MRTESANFSQLSKVTPARGLPFLAIIALMQGEVKDVD
jgi:hypothetical protein